MRPERSALIAALRNLLVFLLARARTRRMHFTFR